MMRKILITGGAGFIGSHLTRLLLGQGHQVTIVDDLSTGRAQNLAGLPEDRVTLRRERLAAALRDPSWIKGHDAIYHLAAAVGVQLIVDQPVQSIENNVMETAMLLKAAAEHHVPTLITSSSEVYGKSDRVPFREDDDVTYGATIYSRWSYAAAKAIDEYLALAHAHQGGLGVVIVRLFNTIGPRQLGQYGMVAPRFIRAALAGRELEIYGDGRQTRCFCHVSDVVGAMAALLGDSACHGRVYNVGSDEEHSINELADRIIALSGSKAGKRHIPYDQAYGAAFDDLKRRVPDLSRIRQAIGFKPTRNLDDILRELIELERTAG